MKNVFYLVLGIALIAWSFYAFLEKPAPARYQPSPYLGEGRGEVSVNGQTIRVEIADTDEERIMGLSGREALAEGTGMLFVFEEGALQGIWMKDMKFPIDIIWLDESLNIIDIEKNVTPDTYPHVFYPPRPVKYVLETNPGEL